MISTDFRTITLEIAEIIQGQLTWIETNVAWSTHLPQNTIESQKIEFRLIDFSSKAAARLTSDVEKTLDKCVDFYKRVLTTHNIFQPSVEK